MLISYQWDYIEYSDFDYMYIPVNYRIMAVNVPELEYYVSANMEKHINHGIAINSNGHACYSIRGPTYGTLPNTIFLR